MVAGLPSFYFPLRQADLYSQSILTTSIDRDYPLSAIVVFYTLQIFGGHLGIPVILFTLYLTKGMKRHPLLVNFLITWIIYTTSFCVLLYLGKQFGREPSTGLCAVQAALIYGTAVLTPTAGLCFVLNIWFSLRDLTQQKSIVTGHLLRNYSLIAAPYIVFCVVVTLTAVYGAINPVLVSRSHYVFYCTLNSGIVDVVPASAAIILLIVVIFEGLIALKLYRMKTAFLVMNSNGGPPRHLVIRVGIFSLYSFLAIIACITFWAKTGAELPYIIQASLPTAAFIIFGTQKDLLEAWGIIYLWHVLRQKPKIMETNEIPKPNSRRGF
ncbi:hypothetical protein ACEPAI_7690 [Sanghuangporus weigelae]